MTQGDSLAMAMYTLALVPMIAKFGNIVKQVWYADDTAAAGPLTDLRTWCDMLCDIGPLICYIIKDFCDCKRDMSTHGMCYF